jgi:hypothetical protein
LFSSPALAADSDILTLIETKSALLARMQMKAAQVLVKIAHDSFLGQYFDASSDERLKNRHKLYEFIMAAQSPFHVDEMCLIDPKGREMARIVNGDIDGSLSPDETGNPFFKVGMAKGQKQVQIGPVYHSTDVERWVIGFATPVVIKGEKVALLHYEYGLKLFEEAALSDLGERPGRFLVMIDKTGRILADSRAGLTAEKQDAQSKAESAFPAFADLPADQMALVLGSKEGQRIVNREGRRFEMVWRPAGEWIIVGFEPVS